MNSIEVCGLTKKFGEFTAVDHISFQVKKGEIFGFLGANGAGKTTAMRMMCALLRPTSGTAIIAGYELKTQARQIKKRIGYMSQKFSLYNDLSVVENMRLYGTIYGVKPSELRSRIRESLEDLDMEKHADKLVGSIPLGWKQKVAFSTALLHRPDIVFLDEPTSGVDPIVRREFWSRIYKTAATGVTLFVTTHYMDEAEYCGRISIMSNGKLMLVGSPTQIKADMGVDSIEKVFTRFVQR